MVEAENAEKHVECDLTRTEPWLNGWGAIQENVEEGEVDSNWGDQQVVTGKTTVELRLKGAFP